MNRGDDREDGTELRECPSRKPSELLQGSAEDLLARGSIGFSAQMRSGQANNPLALAARNDHDLGWIGEHLIF